MKYHEPINVISPKDFIKIIDIVEEGDESSYSIALIEWEGIKQLAIRWNVARREWDDIDKVEERKICVGMPSSHGYPVWFVLPKMFMNNVLEKADTKLIKIIENLLNETKNK